MRMSAFWNCILKKIPELSFHENKIISGNVIKNIGATFGVNHLSTDFKDVIKHILWVQAVKYVYLIIFYETEKW